MPTHDAPHHVVIVGASLAGLRAAESLREHGHDGPITVIGEEPHRPYDRPPLSKQLLTGKIDPDGTAWPIDDDLGAEWVLGTSVVALDVERRRLTLADGTEVAYDGLVLATGARPRQLALAPPGPGVHYLRTLDESVALRDDLRRSKGVAVIGAGFIGLEVASSAQELGIPVVVLEALPVPLDRALGPHVGRAVMEWHLGKGLDLRAHVAVTGLQMASGRPQAVRLGDGSEVAADTVVVGVGVAPATGWLEGAQVDLDDGVLCDDRLRVLSGGRPRPDVVAAGDVARWAHPGYQWPIRLEHWTNANDAGEAAALTLLRGDDAPSFGPVPYFWSDQHGVKLQFVGRAETSDETQLIEGSYDDDRFVVAYGREGRLVAALGVRRPARIMALQRQIETGGPYPPES